MDVAERTIDAHEAAATWDCSRPNCGRMATKKGPGGNPYCDPCLADISAKKSATSRSRHGTAGGGGYMKLLIEADRAELDLEKLTRRMRTEAKAVERAAKSARAEVLLPQAKRELALSIQALAVKMAAITVSQTKLG